MLNPVQTVHTFLDMPAQARALRAAGDELGALKLEREFSNVVLTLTPLGPVAARTGTAALTRVADGMLDSAPSATLGVVGSNGRPVIDFGADPHAWRVAERISADKLDRILPDDAVRLGARPPGGVGIKGIDDIFSVNHPNVDYVIVETKFNSATRSRTKAGGLQLSDGWLLSKNRVINAVGDRPAALKVENSIRQGRVERWHVHVDYSGNMTIGLVDRLGAPARLPGISSQVIK